VSDEKKVHSFLDYSYIRLTRREVKRDEKEGVGAYVPVRDACIGYSDDRMCGIDIVCRMCVKCR